MSTPLITAHAARPGLIDDYVDFVRHRKLAAVRALPSVERYNVYRVGDVFNFGAPAADAPRYDVIAILEVNDVEQARRETSSPEFEALRDEYKPLILPRPGLFVAEALEQRAAMSAEEYAERRAARTGER